MVAYCQVRLSGRPIIEVRRHADDGSVILHQAEQLVLLNCSRVPSINQLIYFKVFNSHDVCGLCLSTESCYTYVLLVLLPDQASFFQKKTSKNKQKAEYFIFKLAASCPWRGFTSSPALRSVCAPGPLSAVLGAEGHKGINRCSVTTYNLVWAQCFIDSAALLPCEKPTSGSWHFLQGFLGTLGQS